MTNDERVAAYRLRASQCADLAFNMADAQSRHSLLVMAKAWLSLAEQVGKFHQMKSPVYGTPEAIPEVVTPQQQQQSKRDDEEKSV